MKNWLVYLLVFVGFLAIGLVVFSNKDKNKTDSTERPAGAEDFNDFYNKFLEDSLFQISRINFPLEGLPSYAGEEAFNSFYWTLDNWIAHKKVDYNEIDFTQSFIDHGYMVTENAKHPDGWGLERRFKLDEDNLWYLIYYAGINRISKK